MAIRVRPNPCRHRSELGLKAGDEVEILVTGRGQFEIGRDRSRERALERLRALRRPLPKGFRFEREEANAR